MAVLPEPRDIRVEVSERDLKWEYMRASGAGGQAGGNILPQRGMIMDKTRAESSIMSYGS